MNTQENKREFGADVIRITATFFIVSVHFYLHNGFYSEAQTGLSMLIADVARWLFFTCVPLFAMLTGYLKCYAVPNRKYYRGILPTLVTWLLISLLCIAFKIGYLHQEETLLQWLAEILNYKAANYAWYIELYFSLFLFCPLLNCIFRCEEKYHKVAVITFTALAFLPSIGNNIRIKDVTLDFIPNYISGVWPFAYYILGGYIRIHQPRFPKKRLFLVTLCLCVVKGLMTYLTANGGSFSEGIGGGYNDWLVGGITVSLFLLLYQLHTDREKLRTIAAHISVRCLIIYLISWIFDSMLQPLLQPCTTPDTYWWVYWIHVLSVFFLSLAASEILYPLIRKINK
jgi:surface polysaccharide O-acyltransferase-like enzyme